jgi:hypothetical protein
MQMDECDVDIGGLQRGCGETKKTLCRPMAGSRKEANQWGKRVNGKSVDGRGINVKAVSLLYSNSLEKAHCIFGKHF